MHVPLDRDAFERLPRHPDWHYSYSDGAVRLTHAPQLLRLTLPTSSPVTPTEAGSVTVSVVTPADRDIFIAFLQQAWGDEEPFVRFDPAERQERLLDDVPAAWKRRADPGGVLARRGGRLVGAALVVREPERDVPCLAWLIVSRQHRRAGIATAVLAGLLPALREHGEHALFADVPVSTLPALRWHLRQGFRLEPEPLHEVAATELARGADPQATTEPERGDLVPVRVGLAELAAHLEGRGVFDYGARLNISTGEIVPEDIQALTGVPPPPDWDDQSAWLVLTPMGSRGGFHDMEVFADTVADLRLRAKLQSALKARKPFRAFKDALSAHEEELSDFFAFTDERAQQRAREWLAARGYRPVPPAPPEL